MVPKTLFDLDKGQIWENCLQLLLQSSKSPKALPLKLGCQSWPLIVYALCFWSGCLKARKVDLLEMTGWFCRCLGFFTFRGPRWTSAHHHFPLTMVSLQSGPRWWSGPLTDISPNTPDSPFTEGALRIWLKEWASLSRKLGSRFGCNLPWNQSWRSLKKMRTWSILLHPFQCPIPRWGEIALMEL